MKDLKDLATAKSPCAECLIRRGYGYSAQDTTCQSCEYNIALQMLKRVLKAKDECLYCQNYQKTARGYYACKLKDFDFKCSVEKDFILDWERLFRDFNTENL